MKTIGGALMKVKERAAGNHDNVRQDATSINTFRHEMASVDH